MLLRLAMLGGLGYAAYNYYTKNREQVDGAIRRMTQGGGNSADQSEDAVEVAGGPLSSDAQVVPADQVTVT